MMISFMVLLLPGPLDVPTPPDAGTVRAVWLADLTPDQIPSSRHGRFVFVPGSLVDQHDGCYGTTEPSEHPFF